MNQVKQMTKYWFKYCKTLYHKLPNCVFQSIILLISLLVFFGCEENASYKDGSPPKVDFEFEEIVTRGQQVLFTNLCQDANSYNWSFGDGTKSIEKEPIHVYETSGWHTIVLTALNESGSKEVFKMIFVRDITVMSYNILAGGGAILELFSAMTNNYRHDRRSMLLNVIKAVNPDILAFQEALLWDSYTPKIYESFAESLEMPYYYYPEHEEAEWNGLCVYSKFPIVSTDFLLHQPCHPERIWNGTFMVKTKLKIRENYFLDFYNCHLTPLGEEYSRCELSSFVVYAKDSIHENAICLGDFNRWTTNPARWNSDSTVNQFNDLGLYFLDPAKIASNDQIWATKKLLQNSIYFQHSNTDGYDLESLFPRWEYSLLPNASDHEPVVAYLGLNY